MPPLIHDGDGMPDWAKVLLGVIYIAFAVTMLVSAIPRKPRKHGRRNHHSA